MVNGRLPAIHVCSTSMLHESCYANDDGTRNRDRSAGAPWPA
jgi:hypothetical protein